MLLKHRGNGHIALGHGELVLGDGDRAVLYLPLLEVVPGSGGGGQGHGVASGGGGHICLSRAALGGIVHGNGVGDLAQADLQLIQLRRFGVRGGEYQGALTGLVHHQLEGNRFGHIGVCISGTLLAGSDLVVGLAPYQLVGSGAAAVGSGDGIGPRHRGVVVENNGISRIEAVDIFAVAGPIILNHSDWPLFAGAHHVVQFTKLRLQGGSLTLAREDKGICFGVLRPLHQAFLGSFNGLLGIGKGFGGRSLLCQYLFGFGNGLSIGIPAALVPLRMLGIGLVHQSLDLLFGHFRSGNHRTGAADLPQARPSAVHRGLHIHPHISPGLVDIHRSFGSSLRGDRRIVKSIVSKLGIVRHRHMILPCGGLLKHQVQLLYMIDTTQIHLPPVGIQVFIGAGMGFPVCAPLGGSVPIVGLISFLIGELGTGAGGLAQEDVSLLRLSGLHPQFSTGHVHIG